MANCCICQKFEHAINVNETPLNTSDPHTFTVWLGRHPFDEAPSQLPLPPLSMNEVTAMATATVMDMRSATRSRPWTCILSGAELSGTEALDQTCQKIVLGCRQSAELPSKGPLAEIR